MNAVTSWSRDEFLGACLGRAVFKLQDAAAADTALAAARAEPRALIETRVPVDQVATLAALTDRGFHVVDTNVQLDCPAARLRVPSTVNASWQVRAALAADDAAVRELCAVQMTTSRFNLDPHIEHERAAQVKREWAGNFFTGKRGDGMYVVEMDATVAGFLLVIEKGALGVIDLIAIEPRVRGSGAVQALLTAWCSRSAKLERILVGTQISNTRSLRAYEKLGFRVCGASHVLHCHVRKNREEAN